MKKRLIVFAPHPDDETLGCGGTIVKRLKEGYEVNVVFLTDGRHALTRTGMSSEITPFELKEIRKEEAIKAIKILGLREREIFFLDYEDSTLRNHEREVQKRIVEILRRIEPVEVFFPQEREYHIDHRATNLIMKKAIEKSNLHPIEYQYIVDWLFPFDLLRLVNEDALDRLMSKLLKRSLIRVNISEFLPLKELALNEYKSQVAVLSNSQKRPALKPSFVKRFLKNEEKFFADTA